MFNYTLYFLDDADSVVALEHDLFCTDFPALAHADSRLEAGTYRAVEVWWAGACIYRQRKPVDGAAAT
jgi:hypothetical protein